MHSSIVSGLAATKPFIAPESFERERGRPLRLRLGANESMFGASPMAIEAMVRASSQANLYPDPDGVELRTALAEGHGLSIQEVALASGIDELLSLLARVFINPGDTVVTSLGSYPNFEYCVNGVGAIIQRVRYRDDAIDLEALSQRAHETSARMVYLANPDNPSGSWHEPSAVLAFIATLPPDCTLLLDEAYAEFAPDFAIPAHAAVVRSRTFSKAYGLAGARVGYVIGSPDHIGGVNKIRMQFGVSRTSQIGALAALGDQDFLANIIKQTAEGRKALSSQANALGLKTLPSHTNFVCIDMGDRPTADKTVTALLERDVFVRKPWADPLDRCIRVSIGTPEQMEMFGEDLRTVLLS